MAPSADLSSLRDERTDDTIPTDLPEQGGGSFLVVLPQILSLRLPADLMQAWEILEEKVWLDTEKKVPAMKADGAQATIQRIQWTFGKDTPLTIVAPGNKELDGQPAPMVRISNIPRRRSSKPDVPPVADATYLLRTSLAEPGTTTLSTPKEWVLAMAKHAGEVFRVETGLSAYCNKEKTRYIPVPQYDANQQLIGYDSVEDPSGQKGCGKRYYTTDFKVQGQYTDRVQCQAGKGGPKDLKATGCGAYLRGFFTIERFLARS